MGWPLRWMEGVADRLSASIIGTNLATPFGDGVAPPAGGILPFGGGEWAPPQRVRAAPLSEWGRPLRRRGFPPLRRGGTAPTATSDTVNFRGGVTPAPGASSTTVTFSPISSPESSLSGFPPHRIGGRPLLRPCYSPLGGGVTPASDASFPISSPVLPRRRDDLNSGTSSTTAALLSDSLTGPSSAGWKPLRGSLFDPLSNPPQRRRGTLYTTASCGSHRALVLEAPDRDTLGCGGGGVRSGTSVSPPCVGAPAFTLADGSESMVH